jgi:FkbM family methyltransferase
MPEAPWRIRALRGLLRRLPRGRYRALASAPDKGRFTARLADEIGGALFDCDLSDLLSREVCFTGLYEPPVTRVFQRQLRPGGTAMDVGANWGYFTLLAAASVGSSGAVVSLEPDPRQYDALARNVEMNGFTHVTTVRAAASARSGRVTLLGYADEEANRGVTRIAAGTDRGATDAARQFEVDAVTIDGLMPQVREVDLVKIDVEGAEDLVLEGMREGLSLHRYRAVLLELHPKLLEARGVDPESCLTLLQQYGYRGWTIDASESAYRRAIDPARSIEPLLRPLDEWRRTPWPHLLWLC